MCKRTYSTGPCGHRVYFDPLGVGLRQYVCLTEWWCTKCNKGFKLTPQEKRLIMIAYKYGRECGKKEIRNTIKASLSL